MMEALDGCELFLLAYLFCNHFAAAFIHFVSPWIAFGADDFVKPAVDEFYCAVVLNGDSDAPGLPNHIPEVSSARDSQGPAVVVGAVYSLDESQTLYVYVLPISRVIKRHRIGMSGIKPTD